MPKQPVSVTLNVDNLIWLRGRATSLKRRSLSEAIDEVLTAARAKAPGLEASRSVAGTIDLAVDDPELLQANAHIRDVIEASLSRPLTVREERAAYATAARSKARQPRAKSRRSARG